MPPDPENGGVEQGWANPGIDDREWTATTLPWPWDDWDVVKVNGVVWFRKAVEIPPAWAGKPLRLHLGTFADLDTTYFNGIQVGRTTARDTGGSWMCWRRYEIPGELARAGRAVIAMRLAQYMGGGPVGLGCMMQLKLDRQNAISLMGPWRMKHERVLPIDRHRPSPPRGVPRPRALPTKIYNGMIAPLTGYTIRGAIWYQGESNARRSYEYPKLLSTMIRGWRRAWGYEFPFYIAQLANYHSSEPWVELMDAQRETLDLVPQTGLAVIHDVGDPWDIHPRNKQAVGHRLALIALAKTYGRDIECSGPLYDRMALEGNRVRVSFSHVGKGLRTKDGKSLRGFLIASQDRQFIPARAEIEPAWSGKETASTIRVWSDSVKNPVAVRYAWSANPDANLTNHTGLPASCFRTDDWPRMTASLRYYKQEEDGWPVP